MRHNPPILRTLDWLQGWTKKNQAKNLMMKRLDGSKLERTRAQSGFLFAIAVKHFFVSAGIHP